MAKAREVRCPRCQSVVRFLDVLKRGQCSSCKTRLCLPKAHFLIPRICGLLLGVVFVVETYSRVLTSPASFPLVMAWILVVAIVAITAQLLFMLLWFVLRPPRVDFVHAN